VQAAFDHTKISFFWQFLSGELAEARRSRLFVALLLLAALPGAVLTTATARADELAEFNAAVEAAANHNRVALGYLHTGNNDLAALEIDRQRAAWQQVIARFGKPPAAFTDRVLYATTLTDVSRRLAAAGVLLNSGRPQNAAQSLAAIRAELSKLRASAGIELLPDCILQANAAMDALMVYNKPDVDLNDAKVRDNLADKASRYTSLLDRCDARADAGVRQSAEFRRLVDGAKKSLLRIPKAILDKDAALLHRVLIELRAIDHLLAFRFG
jgi:type II secretory pathway pseudopilin PulG